MSHQTQTPFGTPLVALWNPYINDRRETHLEYTVWYVSADGRLRWASGIMNWSRFADAESHQDAVLALMTPFVRQQWFRIELSIPNRDAYGNLNAGHIKDTGFLLVTRELLH